MEPLDKFDLAIRQERQRDGRLSTTGDSTRALEEAIQKLPEIVSCHSIRGAGTFELQVITQNLDRFSLGEVKASSALPLGHLKP